MEINGLNADMKAMFKNNQTRRKRIKQASPEPDRADPINAIAARLHPSPEPSPGP